MKTTMKTTTEFACSLSNEDYRLYYKGCWYKTVGGQVVRIIDSHDSEVEVQTKDGGAILNKDEILYVIPHFGYVMHPTIGDFSGIEVPVYLSRPGARSSKKGLILEHLERFVPNDYELYRLNNQVTLLREVSFKLANRLFNFEQSSNEFGSIIHPNFALCKISTSEHPALFWKDEVIANKIGDEFVAIEGRQDVVDKFFLETNGGA